MVVPIIRVIVFWGLYWGPLFWETTKRIPHACFVPSAREGRGYGFQASGSYSECRKKIAANLVTIDQTPNKKLPHSQKIASHYYKTNVQGVLLGRDWKDCCSARGDFECDDAWDRTIGLCKTSGSLRIYDSVFKR